MNSNSSLLTPHCSLLTAHCSLLTTHCSLKKNLLAFSAGIDSSALFFLLLENDIPFDIAIVDYGIRAQSKEEVAHAKALAKKYNLQCHTALAPTFESHFEANARKFRYDFFETLIKKEGYATLLTAHQLNDQLEWLLMRLTRGAGVSELLGLEPVSRQKGYLLIRPLLDYSKAELHTYLETNRYPYFIDESNHDEKYERNRFRKTFSDPLLAHYKEGIKRTFHYLREDKARIKSEFETVWVEKALHIVHLGDARARVRAADLTLKQLGYLLSAAQRKEIEIHTSLVIGGVWAVAVHDNLLYIAPYLTTEMPKRFKERCRREKIPAKIRAYLYQEGIDPLALSNIHSP